MKVRFKGWSLIDEYGEECLIVPVELLRCCLEASYKTSRILDIIDEGVKEYLGGEIVRNNSYRQSELFNFLEQGINNDPRYQTFKENNIKMDQIKRNNEHAYKMNLYYSPNVKRHQENKPHRFRYSIRDE